MRRIIWSDEAADGLESIQAYISQFNPVAAERTGQQIVSAAESLSEHPERGRKTRGRIRELTSIHPYVIRYQVNPDAVIILRIRHGARRPG